MASPPGPAPIAALLPASVEWRGEGYPDVSDPIPGVAEALVFNQKMKYLPLEAQGATLHNDTVQRGLVAQLTESLILMSDHHSRGRDFPSNAADCLEWTASIEIKLEGVTYAGGLSLQREVVQHLEYLCSVRSKLRIEGERGIHWTFSGFAEDVMHAAYAGRLLCRYLGRLNGNIIDVDYDTSLHRVRTIVAECKRAVSEHELPQSSYWSVEDEEREIRDRERTKVSSRRAVRQAAAYNQHLSLVPLPPISLDQVLRSQREVNPLPFGLAVRDSQLKVYSETLPEDRGADFTELLRLQIWKEFPLVRKGALDALFRGTSVPHSYVVAKRSIISGLGSMEDRFAPLTRPYNWQEKYSPFREALQTEMDVFNSSPELEKLLKTSHLALPRLPPASRLSPPLHPALPPVPIAGAAPQAAADEDVAMDEPLQDADAAAQDVQPKKNVLYDPIYHGEDGILKFWEANGEDVIHQRIIGRRMANGDFLGLQHCINSHECFKLTSFHPKGDPDVEERFWGLPMWAVCQGPDDPDTEQGMKFNCMIIEQYPEGPASLLRWVLERFKTADNFTWDLYVVTPRLLDFLGGELVAEWAKGANSRCVLRFDARHAHKVRARLAVVNARFMAASPYKHERFTVELYTPTSFLANYHSKAMHGQNAKKGIEFHDNGSGNAGQSGLGMLQDAEGNLKPATSFESATLITAPIGSILFHNYHVLEQSRRDILIEAGARADNTEENFLPPKAYEDAVARRAAKDLAMAAFRANFKVSMVRKFSMVKGDGYVPSDDELVVFAMLRIDPVVLKTRVFEERTKKKAYRIKIDDPVTERGIIWCFHDGSVSAGSLTFSESDPTRHLPRAHSRAVAYHSACRPYGQSVGRDMLFVEYKESADPQYFSATFKNAWKLMQNTYATYNGVKVYGAVAKWYPTVTSELKGEEIEGAFYDWAMKELDVRHPQREWIKKTYKGSGAGHTSLLHYLTFSLGASVCNKDELLHGKIDEVYAHLDSIYSKTRRGQEKKKRIELQDAISYYDDPEKFDINAEIVLPRRGAGKGKNRVDENDETDEEEDADEIVEVDQVEEVIRRVFDEGYAQADKDDEEMEFEDAEAEDGVAVDQVTKGGRKGAGPIAGTSGKRREATSEKEQRVGAVKKAKVDSKGKGKAVVVSAGGRVVKRKK